MANRLVRGLIYLLIGAVSLACTVESEPGTGTAGAPPGTGGSGVIPGGGSGGTGTAGVPGASGSSVGGAPTAGTGGGATAGAGGQAGGAAGAAGAAGTAGTAGTAGAGGGPGDGTKSAGCGKQPTEEPRKYLQHDITVNVAPAYAPKFSNRKYYTYLPNNYDPNRAYPLVFYGAGCGAKMSEPQPAMQAEGYKDNAILVFLLQVDSCFQAGSNGTADSPDIPYFDKALTEVQDNYCVDKNKVFMSGYSSGAWFSITLSCSHADKIRGIAVAAGGQQPALPACKGPTAALFFVSSGDGGNPVSGPTGSGVARDRLLAANGCSNQTVDWDPRWPSCKKYTGCDENPVVFCDHGGGHSNGQPEKMASNGWWDFFMSLP